MSWVWAVGTGRDAAPEPAVVGEYGGGRSLGLGDGNETRTDMLPAGSGGRGFEAEVGALGSGFSVDGVRDSLSLTLPKNDRPILMCCFGEVILGVLGLACVRVRSCLEEVRLVC